MNIQSLSVEQLFSLLGAAKAHSERDWLLILVTYLHALRASEAVGFTKDDIVDGELIIQRKKGSMRTVQPLLRSDNPLLDERQPLIEYASNQAFNQSVFPLSTVHFWRLMRKHGKSAGIPQSLCHPHVLKHSRCSHLIKTVGIDVVREWAGHVNIGSTGHYLRRTSAEVAAAVGAAGSALIV